VSPPLLDVFVTGTDTGVGKTYVTARLARAALRARLVPGVLKAAQTGTDDDARWIAEQAPGSVVATVYRSAPPLAPSVAARIERRPAVELGHVVEAVEELRASTDGVLVEGSGGLLVPLNDEHTFADLALALGLPLVVVCRPGLGTINHAALTVEAARRRGLEVAGLVINGVTRKPGLAERTNRAELARIAPVIDVVSHDDALVSA
jgi:dethiobiotin synthetase